MRKLYLLFGICSLIYHQAFPQNGEIYASTSMEKTSDVFRLNTHSLKNALWQIEKQFKVSIAFKDEWVENKSVQKPAHNFATVEEALNELLADTDLNYKRAGAEFYETAQEALKARHFEFLPDVAFPLEISHRILRLLSYSLVLYPQAVH